MSEFMEISVSPDRSSRETALLTRRDGESAFFGLGKRVWGMHSSAGRQGQRRPLGYLYRSSSARNRPWPSVLSQ